ncbi:MAG TPA: SDR family NAD(P)-dependent oxidoreductase [bacterium]|nr:SDR family NAD(P)-dependent oxidoreductase [bacterium]
MKRYDIAVIGMGGIFPGSNNVDEYWKNVLSGKTFITDMPKKYWRAESYYSEDMSENDKSYTKKGSFIDGFEFPFSKYKFPPNTMKGVDTAQLIALESAREALEDAGIKPHSKALDEAVTILGVSGVDDYAHACAYLRRNHYFDRLRKQLQEKGVSEKQIDELSKQFDEEVSKRHSVKMSLLAVGVIPSALSNRIAQVFGAKGYNMTVDAACASSFGALETACHALMAGDAKVAITGGVDLGVNPAIYIGFSRVEGLSFSGISNPFDHKADGLIIGEGGGVVILKRLEDALADGDRVRAIIRGMGSSSDGAGQAIYSPSVQGRARAFKMALKRADVSSHDVQFIEAHATSTVVGDANEYEAISVAYAEGRKKENPLYLGSVKYQIGHLKAAAGVAGLIKTIKGMETGIIPHMPLFEKLTPNVSNPIDSFIIPAKPVKWETNKEGKRIAAVTSSGFGGCNYHVILEHGEKYIPVNKRKKINRDIAIVGVTCRVAGADDVDSFWENVTTGKNVFSKADTEELKWKYHIEKGPENERIYTKVISKLKPYSLDYLKYKILPKSVSQISPTQFLGLDLAGRLLENKGLKTTDAKNIGVSIGAIHDDSFPDVFDPMVTDDYKAAILDTMESSKIDKSVLKEALIETKKEVTADTPPITEHTLPGWMGNIVAGRMANKLNLQGPNMIVDSACSSGLSALIPAVYQLAFGDVDMMISGGLNRQISDVFTAGVSAIGAIAKEDAKPFDEEGSGYIIGDGGVLYLLKRLEDAKKDGDDIFAVIHSINGSSEAESKSMLAPSEKAVRRAITETLKNTTVDRSRIGVVDTHGSANKASDVIEAISVAQEVGQNNNGNPVSITAIKSHIGHLYGGSGGASMLSVIQTLRTRKVPGIRNLKNIRPEISDILDKATPVKKTMPFPDIYDAGAVLSLGLGGTNYFAVISLGEKTDKQGEKMDKKTVHIEQPKRTEEDSSIFTGSSKNIQSLGSTISDCMNAGVVSSSEFKSDHAIRFALTYKNENDLGLKFKSVQKFISLGHDLLPLENQGIFISSAIKDDEKLAFCFPGQGTHYISMGKFLYESNQLFKDIINEVDALAKKHMDFNLIGHIYGEIGNSEIEKKLGTLVGAQVSLFAVELGLAKVLEEKGIIPDVLVGHSFGEISALTFAGVWDIPTAFEVVKARIEAAEFGRNASKFPLGMMSIVCSEERRDKLLSLAGENLILTNINAPGRFVLSGELEIVKKTVELAESFGLEARLLPIGSAFHSRFMEPAKEKFYNALSKLPATDPKYDILSTVTGEYIPKKLNSEKIAGHLSLQLTTKLNLPREIERLHSEGINHYLEVGPGWSMTKMISEILKDRNFKALPTMHPKIGDAEVFARAMAFLTLTGHVNSQTQKRRISDFVSPDMLNFIKTNSPETFEALADLHAKFIKTFEDKIELNKTAPTSPTSQTLRETSGQASQTKTDYDWETRIKQELAKMTGYPLDMLESGLDLEADLGIDSIQRAELWVNLSKEFNIPENAKPKAPVKTITGLSKAFAEASRGETPFSPEQTLRETSGQASQTKSDYDWETRIKQELAKMTGYPLDMLESGLDLEADLGIDSIQRAELWVNLSKEFNIPENAKPKAPVKTITGLAKAFEEASRGETPFSPEQTTPTAPTTQTLRETSGQASQTKSDYDWETRIKQELAKMTGYPLDMLESGLDLEADLGIDSIQRAELWVNLSKEFNIPENAKPKAPVKTITGLSKAFEEASRGETLSPVDSSRGETPFSPEQTSPNSQAEEKKKEFKYELAGNEPSSWELFARNWNFALSSDLKDFNCSNVLIFANKKEDASELKSELKKLGIDCFVKTPAEFLKKDSEKVTKLINDCDTVIYIAHSELASMKADKKSYEEFYSKTAELFELFKAIYGTLLTSPKRIIVPIAKNSAFESRPVSLGIFSSYPAGFFRSLQNELTACKVMLINSSVENWNDTILKYISIQFSGFETGLVNNAPVKAAVSKVLDPGNPVYQLGSEDLVLVTGGARGIVFECVAALAARTGCRLLLTGRTPLPGSEIEGISFNRNEMTASIRDLEMKLVKERKLSLKDAKKEAASLKSAWEVNDNLHRLKDNGIIARYEKCDVSDQKALKSLVSKLEKEGEIITAVVHGAGVQKSKMLPELDMKDVEKTIETKMNPVFAMLEVLDWKKIRFFNSFTSIAGLFGNAGQTDYAFANDMLAEIAIEIKALYPHIQVSTVDWTAWSGTGMVSKEEAKRFAEAGLIPIDIPNGVRMFLKAAGDFTHTRFAVFNGDASFAKNTVTSHSIASTSFKTLSGTHDEPMKVNFSLKRDLYLHQHVVNGSPVVPGTFVSEIFAENLLHKGSTINRLKFRRPLAVTSDHFNIELVQSGERVYIVPSDRPALEGKGLENLSYSSCSVKTGSKPKSPDWIKFDNTEIEKKFAGKSEKSDFYRYLDEKFSHALKTGPIFRGIVSTVEEDGIYYSLVSLTKDAVTSFELPGEFKFNPVLADMAVQVASAWNMKKLAVMAIPAEIESFNIFARSSSTDSVVICRAVEITPSQSTFDVAVYEKDGRLIFTMDKLLLKTIAGLSN